MPWTTCCPFSEFQERLLSPCVEERKSTRDRMKCVTCQMASLRGVGTTAKKNDATASQLLRRFWIRCGSRWSTASACSSMRNHCEMQWCPVQCLESMRTRWCGKVRRTVRFRLLSLPLASVRVQSTHSTTAMECMFQVSNAASAVKERASFVTL